MIQKSLRQVLHKAMTNEQRVDQLALTIQTVYSDILLFINRQKFCKKNFNQIHSPIVNIFRNSNDIMPKVKRNTMKKQLAVKKRIQIQERLVTVSI